ncbi:ATP-binding protein [Winogradskyella thalassocola]|uniref:Histidine kinase-, DNA gyrase B-, and HSP90-like ATPase n=1 Tax=Winogradskyella thalassocola TaxID=262004 RepID=A0A1G8AXB5_9FLAO|nr:sensor histidine kinase [Winogradskyella thalassocola]SDH25446.1 Histidine kinase-, DNA gyrase B-, and HSP90-like ATPase [Winogradskyella thalassocola]
MRFVFTCSLLFAFTFSFAQKTTHQSEVDALKALIKSETTKTKKLALLDSLTSITRDKTALGFDSISRATIDYAIQLDSFNLASRKTQNLINYHNNVLGQPTEGITIFNTYFNTLKNHLTDRNLAGIYIDAGDSFYFAKEVDTAMSYYKKAKAHAEKAGNERVKAFAVLYQGYAYMDEGEFVKASQHLQEASKTFIAVKDTFNIIASKNMLSILYSTNGFINEAKKERAETIALAELSKNYGLLTSLYSNAAADNNKQGLQKERIKNLHKAVAVSEKSNNLEYFKPLLLQSLVIAYAENDSIIKAKSYLNTVRQDTKNMEGIYESKYYKACGHLAFAEKDFDTALKWGLKYLELVKASNHIENIEDGESFLAKVYEERNEYNYAYSHLKAAKKIEDSLKSVQKTNALSYYQTLYETNKRDQRIKDQNSEIALLDEQNHRKALLLWGSIILLIALFSIIYLWRSRKYSQKNVQLQKTFAQDIIYSVEHERKRISSELHDSVGQSLLLIKNKIFLESKNKTDTSLVDGAIDEVRTISQQLHPFQFEKLGLIHSIKNTIENFQKNSYIFYSEDIEIEVLNISKDKEIFIYRMLQECLNNVEKHSEAKACAVSIENLKDAVLFQVKDNGTGFDVTENTKLLNSLGMKTLKERAQLIGAQLSINSVKGKGTTIQIKVQKN